ncbi:MAG: protein kinase [Planctomycetia bacterium]|nr:protein kinase [Planctomycetia bacterium]
MPSQPGVLDEVLAVYLRALESGQNPNRDDLLARHPELADELREFFADHDRMNRLAAPLCEPTHVHPAPAAVLPLNFRYFGDYEVLEEIARGGMGVVFKARQVTLNRIVAIKMILSGQLASPADVERFHTEAEAAAKLDHPGIVPIYEVGLHDGQHYFSMGFIEGVSLSARVAQGPLPPREAAEIVRAVAEAVQYAHDSGVIHRDLKPGNILLDRQSKPRVTDFGLAKLTESVSDLTGTGQILGTPGYMPPEQAAAKASAVGRFSDVYSLGAILYCLLTGRPPFQAATAVETLLQVQKEEPVPPRQLNRAVPLDLDTIVLKCLEKSPSRRYRSARELSDELQRYLDGRPILARPVGSIERTWRWCRRNPVLTGLTAALGLVFVVGFAAVAWQWRRADSEWRRAELNADRALTETERALREAANAVDEQKKAQRALQLLKDEQQRSQSLQLGIDDLESRRDQLNRTLLTEQRRLSQTYVRLAGIMLKTGELNSAERFLEQCPAEHRSWEWHYYKKQFHPVWENLGLDRRNDLVAGKLSLTLQGQDISFPLTEENSTLTPAEQTTIDRAVARALDLSFEGLPPGSAKLLSRASNTAGGRVAVAIQWRGSRKDIVCRVIVVSAATGDVVRVLPWEGDPIQMLAFSSDGRWLACLGAGAALVWDTATDFQGLSIGSHRGDVFRVAMSPDGIHLASVPGRRGTTQPGADAASEGLKVWNIATGELVCCLPDSFNGEAADGHTTNLDVNSVTFSHDGSLIAAIGGKGFRVWRLSDLRELASVDRPGYDIAFSADGHLYTTGSNHTALWNIEPVQLIVETSEGGTGIAVHPNGNEVTVAGANADRVFVLDSRSLNRTRSIPTNTAANRLRYSPDGRRLAVAEGRRGQSKDLIQIFDTESGIQLHSLRTEGDEYVFDVDFSPDGALLASANSNAVHIWDSITGQNVLQLKVADAKQRVITKTDQITRTTNVGHRAYSVAFSRDGKSLAAGWGYRDGNVVIWDTALGEEASARRWVRRTSAAQAKLAEQP